MRTYSLTELFHLTRNELFALHAELVTNLASLPDAAPERPALITNLRDVRRVLATPKLSP